jgi:DNA-binding CsgD family transcriptional regulator
MLPNEGWERFLRAVVPAGLSMEETRARVREYQRTVTLEDWNAYMHCMEASDVGPELEGLSVPVLVMHPRDSLLSDKPDGPMKLAASIRRGRFVSLDGEYFGDTATQALGAIDTFVVEFALRQEIRRPVEQSGVTEHVLSARELEVLRLIAAGKSNAQIADELVISQNTVIRHVSNIFAKTGVANRAEAASYAHTHGVV